jgi:hypothetical protein
VADAPVEATLMDPSGLSSSAGVIFTTVPDFSSAEITGQPERFAPKSRMYEPSPAGVIFSGRTLSATVTGGRGLATRGVTSVGVVVDDRAAGRADVHAAPFRAAGSDSQPAGSREAS